jgi:hypothetical protein
MSDLFGKLKSGAGKVAHEADKAAHVKRIELDIGNVKKQVDNLYQKLGELTYQSKVGNVAESPEAAGIYAKITDLKAQISQKELDIKNINEDIDKAVPSPPSTSEPLKKVCPSCGKDNDPNVKFCSECGAKMT